jgi:hypothetical protein
MSDIGQKLESILNDIRNVLLVETSTLVRNKRFDLSPQFGIRSGPIRFPHRIENTRKAVEINARKLQACVYPRAAMRPLKMPQNVRLTQLREVSGHVLGDLGADLRFELLKKGMIDFPACGEEASIYLGIASKDVQALSQLANKPFAAFQLNVVALSIGHGTGGGPGSSSARKAARLV